MIFEFLCLAGPGALSFVVCQSLLHRKGIKRSAKLSILEAIAYAVLNMAIVVMLLKPIDRVQLRIAENGMLVLYYGSTALLLAVVLAIGLGVAGAMLLSKEWRITLPNTRRRWQQGAVYLVLAIAAVGVLKMHIGSANEMNIHVSTMPVKINDAIYCTQTPLYFSDTTQDYFICARELAQGLGIMYEKEPGLLREKHTLGESSFTVSRISPGEHVFMQGGELFLSFSYLTDVSGPFTDIHIASGQQLSDGSQRESIYIDNYKRPFQYAWTENEYICHAMGGIDGQTHTNSLEAFEENYQKGHRVFEVDLQLTADNALVAVHDQPLNKDGKPMTKKQFMAQKIQDRYTPLSFEDIVQLMVEYPDIYLVTDTKLIDTVGIEKQFTVLLETAKEIDADVLTRIIPQIYHEEMYDTIMSLYDWNSMIYTLYALNDFSEKGVADFAYQKGIQVITTHAGRAQPLFFRELFARGILVYMHTYNSLTEISAELEGVKSLGISGVYTDFLYPGLE